MVTVDASDRLYAKIADLVSRDQEVTLTAIGGIDTVPESWAGNAMFPYVADAAVGAWGTLSDSQHEHASDLFGAAITNTDSALALNDTCQAVVPAATDLGIVIRIKNALCSRAAARSTQSEGALAAISIRWLAHLAVSTHTARPALFDLLASVALNPREPEPMPFAIAAAQVAGLAHDFWREQIARECLERLTSTDAVADAWFGLGQAWLVKAFEASSRPAVMEGLDEALKCFDNARNSGEDRPDAKLYAHIIRFVTELANDAPAKMLEQHVHCAESALREYMLGGRRLPEQPMWLHPRYTVESAWSLAIRRLHNAIEERSSADSWYQPAIVISALSAAYIAANSLCPSRYNPASTETAEALPGLVAPQLTAPFLENAERLAFVKRWLSETDNPDSEAFARLVNEAVEKLMDEEAADSQVVPPKKDPPGDARRSQSSSAQNPQA